MMHIEHGRWIIACDDCDEVYDTETKDKEEAIQVAMNNGWVVIRGEHWCEECAEEHNAEE